MSPQPLPRSKQHVRRTTLDGARVLVAEDNLVNLEVARFHLEDLGCRADAAVNGAEALALATREPFDFILLDCQMPVMDGFEALAALRALGADHFNGHVPILAVTAADDTQSKQACARAGFDGFLSKPFSAAQLRAALLSEAAAETVVTQSLAATEAPTLDRGHLTAFVADFGMDTMPSLLASYVKMLSDSIQRLDLCVTQNDAAGLQALGHKLTGASGTIGARRLQQYSKEIDTRGKNKQLQVTPDACALRGHIMTTRAILAPLTSENELRAFLA